MEVCRKMMNFEETELRLGLPGGGGGNEGESGIKITSSTGGKRGFSETIDLKLNNNNNNGEMDPSNNSSSSSHKEKNLLPTNDPAKPPAAKSQVVGWPPVRSSFRRNISSSVQKSNNTQGQEEKSAGMINMSSASASASASAAFVKVSMDGAPYLRKVDLKMFKSYQDLSDALGKMFSSFTIGNCGAQGMKDFMNESKLMDLLNGTEYVPTYQDKDGDWMLVGDVPWEMFVDSCKRLRIMKGSEAIGLAPRAVEKCKNRS